MFNSINVWIFNRSKSLHSKQIPFMDAFSFLNLLVSARARFARFGLQSDLVFPFHAYL